MTHRSLLQLVLTVFIAFGLTISSSAQDIFTDQNEVEYFFYIPDEKEFSDYIGFIQFLQAIENGDEVWDDANGISWFFENFYSKNTLHSLAFESFLLIISDRTLQKQVVGYMDEEGLDDDLSLVLRRRYLAEARLDDAGNMIGYVSQEGMIDEGLDLFHLTGLDAFKEEMGVHLFINRYMRLGPNESNQDPDRGVNSLLFAGNTNSMTIIFEKYPNRSLSEYEDIVNQAESTGGDFSNWTINELNMVGVMERSGADKAWIGFGTDTDAPPGGQEMGKFEIYLYSDVLQTGYSVSYFMNIVARNLTYPIRDRRWNRLLMQLPYVFLNVGPDK